MRFGIFSNGLRGRALAADTYDADLEEIVAADELGFEEAWVSEHFGGWLPDVVPAADLLIAKAAGLTRRIRLGPAVRLLPLSHPLDVATSAAMCDHLLRGRYLFGFGSGVPFVGNMERRGMSNDLRHPMVLEAIEFVLKCWTSPEPFDWDGRFWRGTGITMTPRCYQQPYPPIAVASGQPDLIRMAAERGWTVLISQFDPPEAIAARAAAYLAAAGGLAADRSRLTVARHVHVGGTVRTARQAVRADVNRALDQWKRVNPERFAGFLPAGGSLAGIDFDAACASGLFIAGDPDTVFRQLREVYNRSGGFGTLLLVMGKDWGTAAERTDSLRLFMSEVAPRLRAAAARQGAGAA